MQTKGEDQWFKYKKPPPRHAFTLRKPELPHRLKENLKTTVSQEEKTKEEFEYLTPYLTP